MPDCGLTESGLGTCDGQSSGSDFTENNWCRTFRKGRWRTRPKTEVDEQNQKREKNQVDR